MKPAYALFLVIFLLFSRVASGQKDNNSVLDRKITLEVKHETIPAILDILSAKAGVFFSYNASLIDSEKRTDLTATDRPIRQVLDLIFEGKYSYLAMDEQIIITLKQAEEIKKNEVVAVEESPAIFIFKGRVYDREEKDVLPYTSISVFGSNIGTISNTDGDFELKIPESLKNDTVVISCLGYRQYRVAVSEVAGDSTAIYLQPTTIQLKEIKVTVINPQEILDKILSKINLNYSREPEIMTSFYREVLKQDNDFIDVAEAVMEIRKSPYDNSFSQDKVRVIKGRKNINVKPFQYVDFKIQGGPYYITKLDAIKTLDSFLDPEFRDFYKYALDEIVEIDNRETYVIKFKPKEKVDYPCYQGKLYVDMSSFALVMAEFSLARSGLKFAHESLIRKKPKDFYVRPIDVDYMVSYRRAENKWHLSSAQASIKFRVRSKKDKINSLFHSVSDLLITDFKSDNGTQFKKNELFSPRDIFSEVITTYDEGFWGNYNIIKPTEDLQKALRKYYLSNDSLFQSDDINKVQSKP